MAKRLTGNKVNKFIESLLERDLHNEELFTEVESFLKNFTPPKVKVKKVKVRRGIGSY